MTAQEIFELITKGEAGLTFQCGTMPGNIPDNVARFQAKDMDHIMDDMETRVTEDMTCFGNVAVKREVGGIIMRIDLDEDDYLRVLEFMDTADKIEPAGLDILFTTLTATPADPDTDDVVYFSGYIRYYEISDSEHAMKIHFADSDYGTYYISAKDLENAAAVGEA